MAHYKANRDMIRLMTDEDKTALFSIYQHRCLDEFLLSKYIYDSAEEDISSIHTRITQLIDNGLVAPTCYGAKYPALFLTTLGVETIKAIYGDKLCAYYLFDQGKKNLPLSSALKMHPKLINHQMHLNSFAMEFESYTCNDNYFRYYDEKFMPPASNFMMPDAMVELSSCYVLLELDMGTEAYGRLAQKWNSYRTFLNDPKGFYSQKTVVMLFIIDGVKNVSLRKKNVTAGIIAHIADRITANFEVYIDGPNALHEIIKARLLPQGQAAYRSETYICQCISQIHDFALSQPSVLKKLDMNPGYYIRKLDGKGKIVTSKGRMQEFLMDIWLDGRLSVLRNILIYQRSLRHIKELVCRDLAYIVVLPSEKEACTILKELGISQPNNVFFTTPERLAARPWPNALFSIDQLHNLAYFIDESLEKTKHERRMHRISRS